VFNEQRTAARKIFKVKAVATMDGHAPMLVRTMDISANGVSISVPEPMQAGQAGQLSFDLLVDGKAVPITARVKAMYCIFSSGEFKVGFQFLNLDLNAMTQLSRFLR
jgi:c-di-GMP-binding flagellar brake protein YcgR